MSILAIVFWIIFIICIVISLLCLFIKAVDADTDGHIYALSIFLVSFTLTAIVFLINFFFFPQKDTRYVATTSITSVKDISDITGKSEIYVGEPCYIQIQVIVEANSFARRFFNDKEIPFRVEISNPDISSYTIQRSKGYEEYKEPEYLEDKTIYHLKVLADRP